LASKANWTIKKVPKVALKLKQKVQFLVTIPRTSIVSIAKSGSILVAVLLSAS
jgi:hypothetical protein